MTRSEISKVAQRGKAKHNAHISLGIQEQPCRVQNEPFWSTSIGTIEQFCTLQLAQYSLKSMHTSSSIFQSKSEMKCSHSMMPSTAQGPFSHDTSFRFHYRYQLSESSTVNSP